MGGAAGATAGGGTGEDDMEVEEITAPDISDWDWQPAVKETVGNVKKRMKILETVAWCVRCGKRSGTRKSKDGQWVVLNGHVAKPKKGGDVIFLIQNVQTGRSSQKSRRNVLQRFNVRKQH